MNIVELRQKLDEATHGFPKKHIERIAALQSIYPHNISLNQNPAFFDSDDCLLYAFKDILPSDLRKILVNLIMKNSGCFEDIGRGLISEGFISLHDEQKESDIIVVYFDGDVAKHYGRIERNRIVSKWGNGYAWKHDLFEVPLSYGDTIKFSNGEIDQGVFRMVIKAHSEPKPEVSSE